MVRQEGYPQCGSKKITVENLNKKCKTCAFQWSGKASEKTARKDKIGF